MPQRIQRRRTVGWRMPKGAYVGRGTKWGNPHRVGTNLFCESGGRSWIRKMTTEDATSYFECDIRSGDVLPFTADEIRSALRGHDLACWCPLPEPGKPDHCHAAVLLDLANGALK